MASDLDAGKWSVFRRLFWAFAALVMVTSYGTAGYMLLEGWSPLDALYMTAITIGTVGFGEVHALSDIGRLFTVSLIFAGVGAIGFSFGTFVEFLVEGHLQGFLEARRMQNKVDSMTGHHIVAGLGRVGIAVAEALEEEDAPFVVIDRVETTISTARARGWAYVLGDAADEDVLTTAGLMRAKSLVTALDTDADNLYVTVTAKQMRPEIFIVARSSHVVSEAKLIRAGANRVITPNAIGGRRMANMVMHPIVADYLDLVTSGHGVEFRLQEVEIREGSPVAEKSIGEARVRERTGAYVLAVVRPTGHIDSEPSSSLVINAGDKLIVLGTPNQLEAFDAQA